MESIQKIVTNNQMLLAYLNILESAIEVQSLHTSAQQDHPETPHSSPVHFPEKKRYRPDGVGEPLKETWKVSRPARYQKEGEEGE